MVDAPRISPQGTSRRVVGEAVPVVRPEDAQLRSLRNIPSLRLTGLDNAARALNISTNTIRLASDAFQSTTDDLLDRVRQDQALEAERRYAEQSVSIQERIEDLKVNVDPDEHDFTELALKDYDEFTAELLKDESLTGFQRKILEQKFVSKRLSVGQQALAFQVSTERANAELDFQKYFESQQNRLLSNPSQFENILAETNQYIDDVEVPELDKKKFREEVQEGLAAASITAVARNNPSRAEALIKSDRYNELLDPRSKSAIIKDIDVEKRRRVAEAKRAQAEKAAAIYAEERVAVSRGESSYKRLDDLRKSGDLTDSQWASLTMGLDASTKAREDQEASFADIANTLAAGGGLTDDQSKEWDKYYNSVILPQASQITDPNAQASYIANTVAEAGIIPKSLENNLEAQIRSGSVGQKVQAIDTIKRIKEQNPLIKDSISTEVQAYADRVSEIVDVSPDPIEAIQQVDQEFANPAITEARQKQFKSDFKIDKADRVATQAFDSLFKLEPNAPVEGGVKLSLQNDMAKLAEKYYLQNPDMDKAQEYAAEEIKKTWGETKIGGSRRLMKYAPESVLPSYGGHKWVEEQLKADTGKDLDDVYLVADKLTARTVETRRPAYQVLVKKDNGMLDLLRDENGVVQRFVPDADKAATKFKSERLEGAKTKRSNAKEARDRLGDFGVGTFTNDGGA